MFTRRIQSPEAYNHRFSYLYEQPSAVMLEYFLMKSYRASTIQYTKWFYKTIASLWGHISFLPVNLLAGWGVYRRGVVMRSREMACFWDNFVDCYRRSSHGHVAKWFESKLLHLLQAIEMFFIQVILWNSMGCGLLKNRSKLAIFYHYLIMSLNIYSRFRVINQENIYCYRSPSAVGHVQLTNLAAICLLLNSNQEKASPYPFFPLQDTMR